KCIPRLSRLYERDSIPATGTRKSRASWGMPSRCPVGAPRLWPYLRLWAISQRPGMCHRTRSPWSMQGWVTATRLWPGWRRPTPSDRTTCRTSGWNRCSTASAQNAVLRLSTGGWACPLGEATGLTLGPTVIHRHEEHIKRLETRIETMYVDKLDGNQQRILPDQGRRMAQAARPATPQRRRASDERIAPSRQPLTGSACPANTIRRERGRG